MIFITLADGIITKNMAYSKRLVFKNKGYEKDSVFYTSDLLKVPNIQLTANNGGLSKVGEGQFSIDVLSTEAGYDSVVDFASKDLSVTVKAWDENDDNAVITILTGRAYLGAMDRKQFTYKIKSEKGELANDLLLPAPDIRQNAYLDADKSFYFTTIDQGGNWSNTYTDSRLFPMRLGVLKHASLFPLAFNAPVTQPLDSVGEYYSDGTTYALYDNGLKIRFSQYASDYRVLKNNASTQAVYELTMDIDGDDTAVNSDALSPNPNSLNTTFSQTTEPSPTDQVLKDGMIWIDTTNDINITYIYENGAWVKASVSLVQSTDFVDIPTGTGFRLKANAAATSADPTIFGAYIKGSTISANNMIIETVGTKQALMTFSVGIQGTVTSSNLPAVSRSVYYETGVGTGVFDPNDTRIILGASYTSGIKIRELNSAGGWIDHLLSDDLVINRANVKCDIELTGAIEVNSASAGQYLAGNMQYSLDEGVNWIDFSLGSRYGTAVQITASSLARSFMPINTFLHDVEITPDSYLMIRCERLGSSTASAGTFIGVVKVINY